MKGDSNRFLARSEGSGGKNDCGGATNIGLLGLLGKVRTTCQFLFAKRHRYWMAERREKNTRCRNELLLFLAQDLNPAAELLFYI